MQLSSDLEENKIEIECKKLEDIRNSTYALQSEVDKACCAQVLPHAGTSWDSTPGMSTEAVASAKLRTVERRTMVLE